jgi:hypothetical protein
LLIGLTASIVTVKLKLLRDFASLGLLPWWHPTNDGEQGPGSGQGLLLQVLGPTYTMPRQAELGGNLGKLRGGKIDKVPLGFLL